MADSKQHRFAEYAYFEKGGLKTMGNIFTNVYSKKSWPLLSTQITPKSEYAIPYMYYYMGRELINALRLANSLNWSDFENTMKHMACDAFAYSPVCHNLKCNNTHLSNDPKVSMPVKSLDIRDVKVACPDCGTQISLLNTFDFSVDIDSQRAYGTHNLSRQEAKLTWYRVAFAFYVYSRLVAAMFQNMDAEMISEQAIYYKTMFDVSTFKLVLSRKSFPMSREIRKLFRMDDNINGTTPDDYATREGIFIDMCEFIENQIGITSISPSHFFKERNVYPETLSDADLSYEHRWAAYHREMFHRILNNNFNKIDSLLIRNDYVMRSSSYDKRFFNAYLKARRTASGCDETMFKRYSFPHGVRWIKDDFDALLKKYRHLNQVQKMFLQI